MRGALAQEKLPEKRTFSDVAGASAAKTPPDVQRSGKPRATGSLGPHVERLVDFEVLRGLGYTQGAEAHRAKRGRPRRPPQNNRNSCLALKLAVKLPDDFFNSQQYFRLGTRNYPI